MPTHVWKRIDRGDYVCIKCGDPGTFEGGSMTFYAECKIKDREALKHIAEHNLLDRPIFTTTEKD